MAACLLASALLALTSAGWAGVLLAELALLALAWAGGHESLASRWRLARIAHAFFTLNTFVVLGFVHFVRNRQAHLWASGAITPPAGRPS
jgi:hypothetical protein